MPFKFVDGNFQHVFEEAEEAKEDHESAPQKSFNQRALESGGDERAALLYERRRAARIGMKMFMRRRF